MQFALDRHRAFGQDVVLVLFSGRQIEMWRRGAFSSVFLVLALACAHMPSAAFAKAISVRTFYSGPWVGEVYADDSSGEFLFCLASAPAQRKRGDDGRSLQRLW